MFTTKLETIVFTIFMIIDAYIYKFQYESIKINVSITEIATITQSQFCLHNRLFISYVVSYKTYFHARSAVSGVFRRDELSL